jgi:monoamine oxidase
VFGDLEYINAGSDTLANAFGPMLLDRTRLGPRSMPSTQGPDGVLVHYRDGVGTHHELSAYEAIITVPFVLLRHIEVTGLDVDKAFTLRNVLLRRAHKIFMQFSRRWWTRTRASATASRSPTSPSGTWSTRRRVRTP